MKKKIQNPCSLYQNVKELRKKKKIQNLQDCCRLRIEKRKTHNPLSHCVFKMSFMETFIRGNKKLKIQIFDPKIYFHFGYLSSFKPFLKHI